MTPPARLTLNTLRDLAGDRAYERGLDYFTRGHVHQLSDHNGRVSAKVSGTTYYDVSLNPLQHPIEYACSCPAADDGNFCKHCVAVGLAWLAKSDPEFAATLASNSVSPATPRPRAERPGLINRRDIQLINEDVAKYRDALNAAFRINRFVDYYRARDYADRILDVIGMFEVLLAAGRAEDVITLTECGLKLLVSASQKIDDSDGYVMIIRDALQELHLAACIQARAEPKGLARKLFAWELRGNLEIFMGAAQRHAEVLGADGLKVYRKLATAEWSKVPALKAGERDSDAYGKRFGITRMMESLALASGDVEELIAIKQRDLSSPYYYLEIANVYREADRHDRALAWAEEGIRVFGARTDSRLREFLAAEYQRRERHDEALRIVWDVFEQFQTLEHYELLQTFANPVRQWPKWRAKALQSVRESIARHRGGIIKPNNEWHHFANGTLLVQIYLWENDADSAWHEAELLGCDATLRMQLARVREKAHPDDAIRVYQAEVNRALQKTDKRAYRDALRIMRSVARAMKRAQRESEFAPYVAQVRVRNKHRPSLVAMLDASF